MLSLQPSTEQQLLVKNNKRLSRKLIPFQIYAVCNLRKGESDVLCECIWLLTFDKSYIFSRPEQHEHSHNVFRTFRLQVRLLSFCDAKIPCEMENVFFSCSYYLIILIGLHLIILLFFSFKSFQTITRLELTDNLESATQIFFAILRCLWRRKYMMCIIFLHQWQQPVSGRIQAHMWVLKNNSSYLI